MISQDHIKKKLRGTWLHSCLNTLRRLKQHLMRRSEGERFLLQQYSAKTGKQLELSNPQTFSEKLYCRKIFSNRAGKSRFTTYADKYSVRDYVGKQVGEKHLVKLLWHGQDPKAIPFDTLPSEYVIKSNHASGQVIVVTGRVDRAEIMDKVAAWLRTNYYWGGREFQYFHIQPKIMVEEYLRSNDGNEPLDFRFWCFGGCPEVIQVDNHAHDINPFFDTEWNLLDLHYRKGASRPALTKPSNLEEMISIASRLSGPFDFVRVDLYNVDSRVYFGEMTFTPAGSLTIEPKTWDLRLGMKWNLSLE